ncbi:MAG: LptF/LptG family permease [Candidatus Pelagibacter sp.]
MNKLIYRKLSLDIFSFFLVASLSITLIVWVIQAVNFLDIVSEDGHSLKVYFSYTVLNLPRIFSRILIFIFFVSAFYIINKYEENNEILVFWTNGIKKISFINFLFKFSFFFVILQLILNLLIVPYTQNLGRSYLKNSNIDFLPTLISEKKFINVFKSLTIFIENYNQNGSIEKIFINEKITNNKSKIIIAEKAKIIKSNNQYKIKLLNGSITNINEDNVYNINFKETEYDLSKFNTKTITVQKIQETNSLQLLDCLTSYYITKNYQNNNLCKNRKIKSISQEMFKRIVVPFYIFILSLVSSSLIIKPRQNLYLKYYKFIIFFLGFMIMTLSQISFKFISKSNNLDFAIIFAPILLILFFYLFLISRTKSKFKKL